MGFRTLYEKQHPLILHGKKARFIAIPSTGRDYNSPVSYLFGRAPYFAVCDRAKGTFKAVKNTFVDSQHAAGLRASQFLAKMKVDAVCANNIGFEPMRIFEQKGIEVYTDISGSVFDTYKAFPDGLTHQNKQNVPSHYGITGSKKQVACSTFNAQANVKQIVQGKFLICPACNYRASAEKPGAGASVKCPRCGGVLKAVIAVANPGGKMGVKPKVRVF